MTINSGFSHKKKVIFNSYVKLSEGNLIIHLWVMMIFMSGRSDSCASGGCGPAYLWFGLGCKQPGSPGFRPSPRMALSQNLGLAIKSIGFVNEL